MARGIFIGMATLDLFYYTEILPQKDKKLMADSLILAPGGPALNAARAFSVLGNKSHLYASLGTHPVARIIEGELEKWSVRLFDITPELAHSPPVASIFVNPQNGDRSVCSIPPQYNDIAAKIEPFRRQPPTLPDILLADGHQIPLTAQITRELVGVPLVLDGGSWKPGFERLIPVAKYIICSSDFRPPGCQTEEDVIDFLRTSGASSIAITQGPAPIRYLHQGKTGAVSPPTVDAKDTTGAGDIFHGAFCHHILSADFVESLERAALVASRSCTYQGTDPKKAVSE